MAKLLTSLRESKMKFKMFYFSATQSIDSMEEVVNEWLKDNPNIEIKHFSQSETSDEEGGFEEGGLTASIFYEEK